MKRGLIMEYKVTLTWDPEAKVWVATSEDIKGLVPDMWVYILKFPKGITSLSA